MAPEPARADTLRRLGRGLAIAAALATLASPAHALRVASWNFMRYQVSNVVTTISSRQAAIRTVIGAMDPDILIAQEVNDAAARDSLLNDVFNVVEPGQWSATTWLQLGGEGGVVFYKSAKVTVSNVSSVTTGGPRPVLACLVKPVGYISNPAWFRLYSMHLKAGNPDFTPSDSTARRTECTNLRTSLNNVSTGVVGPNFLIGGDTNFYGSWEGGYQRLTELQLNNNGRCFDPLSMPGTWNSIAGYAAYDTQCPCSSGNCPTSDYSGGGMDDRFDMFLSAATLQDGAGLDYVPGALPNGYGPFGNDGLHFDTDINAGGFNSAVGIAVANALHDASDHLPVVVNLQLPARIVAGSQLAFGDVIVGAAPSLPLAVSNGAGAPADLLRYSFGAPAGFTAPAGNFTAATGAGANVHAIGMDASGAGVRLGTLAVATNDADSTSKPVLLSGRVLAHAVPSLDSLAVVTAGSLDLGDHLAGDFTDAGVRVHDQGYGPLQARLSVDGAPISGGSGRFSIAGGFAPALLAGTGRTWSVHFDPTGATLDSTYSATLTFNDSDEPLPGAAAGTPLTVALRARPLSTTSGVEGGGWTLRFLPPRPNPLHAETELGFDLPAAAAVDLGIYDLGGRRIATLASGEQGEGHHSVRWNTRDDAGRPVPAGLYFARFQSAGFHRVVRLILLP